MSVGRLQRIAFWMFGLTLLAAPLQAQSAPPTIYAESYRRGATTVAEETFDISLTPQDASYKELIKDSVGNDRYEFTVSPKLPGGDDKITSWIVLLKDLRHGTYFNLLMASQEPSEDAKNNLWKLDPNRLGPVPIRARRIVKVDGFYVTMQVKDLHFTPLDSPYLDSMRVRFSFANSDPRARP